MNNLLKTGLIILVVSIISLGFGAKGCPFDIGPWIDKDEETIAGSSVPLTTPEAESPDYQPVSADADDSRHGSGLSPKWSNSDKYAPAGFSPTYGVCRSEFRFTGINVPQGTSIITAYIRFHCNLNSGGSGVKTKLQGEATDNATQITSQADFEGRTQTTAEVDYDDASWTAGTWYEIDITSVIQEIVNHSGWSAGNALRIFFEDDGSPTTGDYRFVASTWDDDKGGTANKGDLAAQLHIEYE